MVGKTSRSRKGTAWDRVRYVFGQNPIIPTLQPLDLNITGGLSTTGGLIFAVRDPKFKTVKKGDSVEVVEDKEGVDDNALMR
jgi:hypothetical protein